MPNEVILFIEIAMIFSMLVLASKLFKEYGLIAWVSIASILANLITVKNGSVFGMTTALGSVMFGSVFLATDILSECYGKSYAKKAVYIGLFSTLIFIISTQISLAYKPSQIDYANDSMVVLFGMNLRVSISSMIMYFLSNMADIYIFESLKKKTSGKYLWLRNNVSTILCNCIENFLFIGLAFFGIYSTSDIVSIAISVSIIEIIVSICDTPFLYAARRSIEKNRISVSQITGG